MNNETNFTAIGEEVVESETLVSVYTELNHGIVDEPMSYEQVMELV